MAHKGIANISVSALRDEVKARFSGSLEHVPSTSTNQYWVYKTATAAISPAVLLATTDDFVGNINNETVAAGDKVIWLAIKNLGTQDTAGSLKTTNGIMMNFSGVNPTFDGLIDAQDNNIVIGPNELFVVKLNGVLQANLKVGTCVLTSGVPSAVGTTAVAYQLAAIVEDIG